MGKLPFSKLNCKYQLSVLSHFLKLEDNKNLNWIFSTNHPLHVKLDLGNTEARRGGKMRGWEGSTEKAIVKGARASFPSGAAEVDSFFISIIFSQHNTHYIQFAVKPFIYFLAGRKGSKIGYVCLKWCHDCTAADSLSSLCFSRSLTRAQGIVVLRGVPVLISHAVHLLELRIGRKLLSTASFRAIFLCQMLTLEPKNRGATVLKLHLSTWYEVRFMEHQCETLGILLFNKFASALYV